MVWIVNHALYLVHKSVFLSFFSIFYSAIDNKAFNSCTTTHRVWTWKLKVAYHWWHTIDWVPSGSLLKYSDRKSICLEPHRPYQTEIWIQQTDINHNLLAILERQSLLQFAILCLGSVHCAGFYCNRAVMQNFHNVLHNIQHTFRVEISWKELLSRHGQWTQDWIDKVKWRSIEAFNM